MTIDKILTSTTIKEDISELKQMIEDNNVKTSYITDRIVILMKCVKAISDITYDERYHLECCIQEVAYEVVAQRMCD